MNAERGTGASGTDAPRRGRRSASPEPLELIEESSLVVDVEGVGRYTLMWTPTDSGELSAGFVPRDGWLGDGEPSAAVALAAGFAFGEGLFAQVDELESIARCPEAPDVVRILLVPAARARAAARADSTSRIVQSSCGACGASDIEHLLEDSFPIAAPTTLSRSALQRLVSTMQDRQVLWRRTGAAHAALLFSPDGEALAFAEDLGRHNALDKVIGRCLLDGVALEGCGAILSSRLSFEMVAKAVRARLAIVAGVSAASSLAVRTAQDHGITLCGFVRDGRATVYTHARRVVADATGHPIGATAPEATAAA